MTFSASKLRINRGTGGSGGGGGGGGGFLGSDIQCGEVVDSYGDYDIFILQDVSGSYPTSSSVPFIRNIASCVLTAFPNAHLGLGYFSDFPIEPYGESGLDTPFEVEVRIGKYTFSQINNWILPGLYGNDEYESQLDAIKRAAEQTSAVGWRSSTAGGSKRFIILNTDTFPHDSALEPGAPHTTKAAAVQACKNNGVWPIYVLTDSYYYSEGEYYDLGYGSYGFGDPTNPDVLISQILTAVLTGRIYG